MKNFIQVHNHDNDAIAIITAEAFSTLQFMFSKNSSYRYLTEEEEKDYVERMELIHNAN